MLVIPALDLRGGQCVRLRQGDYDRETVFGDDPVAVAARFIGDGARFLHLVDLDGARVGKPVNTDSIAAIVGAASAAGVPCQLGGGLRDEAAIQAAVQLGVSRCIVGTRAVRDPAWLERVAHQFVGRIVLGLDARDGRLAVDGWMGVESLLALDFVSRVNDLPLAGIVYTDIGKDGMLAGPNLAATVEIARRARAPVIASGGVTTVGDVIALRDAGLPACILGRALYEGVIDLRRLLQRLADQSSPPP